MAQAQDSHPAAGRALAGQSALAGVGGGWRPLHQTRLPRSGGAPGRVATRAPAAARLAVLAVRRRHAECGRGIIRCCLWEYTQQRLQ